MAEVLTAILALAAGGFCLSAAIGVLRFPDALTRMHASSKVATMGGSLALLAVALDAASAGVVLRAVFAIGFLILTAPIGAHLMGRAAAWRAGADRGPSDAS